jgi:hypothetical protein
MREVLPELLDFLSHDDPEAMRSRDELRLVNRIMGNYRWVCRTIRQSCPRDCRVLELGAGDGALARHAWANGTAHPARWSVIDLAPAPADWPREATWQQRDLLTFPVLPDAEIIIANLFLHQFRDDQLAALGRCLPATCRTFITCDPARHWLHSLQGRLLSVVARFNRVTRHDMHVSIRAGFAGNELATALVLQGWQITISLTMLGAYRLVASR